MGSGALTYLDELVYHDFLYAVDAITREAYHNFIGLSSQDIERALHLRTLDLGEQPVPVEPEDLAQRHGSTINVCLAQSLL